jgi:ubiquinone/menaquinone biosynthesis C-methylase UbiE
LVYGVDVSGEMIKCAESINETYSNILFYQNDGGSLEFLEDASVDYVFSFVTFQHMPSEHVMESNIKEISRVLKPGGALQLDFPVLDGWHRVFGVIPVPRSIKAYIPYRALQFHRSWSIRDPLKRSSTFCGMVLSRRRTERLFADAALECTFHNYPSAPGKMIVQGFKR